MDKHFEPVTARSLATRIIKTLGLGNYFEDQIEAIIEPHIRKPSDDDKSVPARCEEAYNEAVRLLKNWKDIDSHGEIKYLKKKTAEFLNKPNPFTEADIVHKDEAEPTLLPFSLEEAKNGAKVVTRDGFEVRIVADNLENDGFPILYIGKKKNGKSFYNLATIDGLTSVGVSSNDLFILKEPEEVEVTLSRDKINNRLFASVKGQMHMDRHEIIKTITITI